MLKIPKFDAESAAFALEELASALKREPSAVPLAEIGDDLLLALQTARKWAFENRIPRGCIPEAPRDAALTTASAVEFLESLAGCLRYLGRQRSSLEPAPESVALYRLAGGETAFELHELEELITEVLGTLTLVLEDTRVLDFDLRQLAPEGPEPPALSTARERAGRVWLYTDYVVAALRELYGGLEARRLRDTRTKGEPN